MKKQMEDLKREQEQFQDHGVRAGLKDQIEQKLGDMGSSSKNENAKNEEKKTSAKLINTGDAKFG